MRRTAAGEDTDGAVAALTVECSLGCCCSDLTSTAVAGPARSPTGEAAEAESVDGDDEVDGDELEWDRLSSPAMAADEAGRPVTDCLPRGVVAGCTATLSEEAGLKAENAEMWSG